MNPSNGNPGKPGEAIFAKYFNGLRETSVRLGGIDEAAVRLAMHLAITDAYAAREPAPPACHASNATEQRAAIANYDTALTHAQNEISMLRQQRASLQEDLEATQQAREENRQEVQQLRQELTQALQRAAAVDPTPAPDWGPSHPAWQGLTAADLDVIEQLNAGTTTSRRLSGSLRRDLVLAVIRWLAQESGAAPTMFQFDSSKPGWMGMASGVVALESQQTAIHVALQGGITPNDK